MNKKQLEMAGIILAVLFIVADLFIGSYIFNETVRANEVDWTLESEEFIVASSLEGSGSSCFYAAGNSVYFHYFGSPVPTKYAELESKAVAAEMSNNRKYFAAVDEDNTLYFFAYGSGKEFTLRYTASFEEEPVLGGLIVIGKTALTTRLLVYTTNGIYVFNDASAEPIWAYEPSSPVRCATISHYGDIIVVGTENGDIIVLDTFAKSVIWDCNCNTNVTSVSVSPFAFFTLIGTEDGRVLLYSIENGVLEWEFNTGNSMPIKKTYLRSSASESLILDESSLLYLVDGDGILLRSVSDVEEAVMPYWGEYIGISKEGEFLLQRTTRGSADWKYSSDEELQGISSNYGGTTIMVQYPDSLLFFNEDPLIIMGSRTSWALLVLLILFELIVLGAISYYKKGAFYMVLQNKEFIEFFIGAAAGIITALILYVASGSNNNETLIIAAISAGIATWQYSRTEGGIVGAFLGFMTGFFFSMAIGGAFGIYYWLAGSEQNIFSSFIGNLIFGGLNGTIFSLVGVFMGFVTRGFFAEYRSKRK